MQFRGTTLLTVLALILCASCATNSSPEQHNSDQDKFIARWHSCIDRNIDDLDHGSNSPDSIIESTLVTCQGHKRDVLATFPLKYEKRLDTIMTNKAYESGFSRLSKRRGVGDSVTTSYRRLLELQSSGF